LPSRDGKSICAVEANNGIKKSVSVTKQKLKTTGCKVAFTPAMEHFPDVNLGDLQSYMRLRLINLAVSMRKMDIYFNGAQLDNKYRLSAGDDQISLFSDNSLLMIASAQEFTQHTYVNGLFCRHGGSIPDAIASQIVIPLREMISKKHKIDMLPSQIKQHLKVGSWSTGFPNLQFDSQTKDRVTNPTGECLAFLNFDWKKLATQIMKTPSLIDPMIQSALYKKELADRLELARAQKAKKKVRIASHIECTGDKNRTLFLFEGESAANAFLEVRDPKKHGAYALRGKVLNTHGMKWVDIVKNRELSDLMEIIGLKPDKPATMLNYDRILITTDADLDGADITCLLVNFFSRWPELFDGIISRVKSPLWIGTSKTERIYCYSNAEYMKSQKRGIEWNYMKGLGRLEVEDYRTMIETPVIDKISYKGVESLTIAFGDSAQARKDWMQS
jgi:DNA topoisomerase-2